LASSQRARSARRNRRVPAGQRMTGKVGSALIQRYNAFVEMSKNLATGSGFSNGSPGVGVGVCEAPAWLAHSAWQRPARLHPYRFASAMNEPRQPGTSTADPLGSRRRPSSRRHAGPTHHQSGPHAQGASASSRVDAVPLDPVGRDHWRPGRRPGGGDPRRSAASRAGSAPVWGCCA
jgi:hypothetical protein